MTVKKSDLVARLDRKWDKEIRKLEALINKKLLKEFTGHPVVIEVKYMPHEHVQKELERRYHEAGWKLSFHKPDSHSDSEDARPLITIE